MAEWRKIKNFQNYEISDSGDVRSLKTGKVMRPFESNSGYLSVRLFDESRHHTRYIHRLVAENFLDNDQIDFEINHIDGNKHNNSSSNLEWCSHSRNMRHAIEAGLFSPYKLPPNPHPGVGVRIIETGEEFASLTDCAKRVGGVKQGITQCLNGTKKSYKGYHYERS